jgi:hypothetical protein
MSSPDRIIVVPSPFRDGFPARLSIFSPDGETATMSLSVGLEIIARGEGFRRPQYGPFTWLDAPESSVVDTFGAFLAHALESSEDDARDGWSILTDAASDWADELVSLGIELAETDLP